MHHQVNSTTDMYGQKSVILFKLKRVTILYRRIQEESSIMLQFTGDGKITISTFIRLYLKQKQLVKKARQLGRKKNIIGGGRDGG